MSRGPGPAGWTVWGRPMPGLAVGRPSVAQAAAGTRPKQPFSRAGIRGYTGGIAPIVHIVRHSRHTLFPAAERHGTDQYVARPGSGKQGLVASGRIPDQQRPT